MSKAAQIDILANRRRLSPGPDVSIGTNKRLPITSRQPSSTSGSSRVKKNFDVDNSSAKNTRLEPSIIVAHTSSVLQACQKMAAMRASSLLVVEDSRTNVPSLLVGIVTDKDIAYKVIAEGLDPAIVLISSIMTPNPVTVGSGTLINDALQIMTEMHFRHLPVVSPHGEIEGVLDITLAMRSAIEKLRKSEELTRSLSSAVEHITQESGFLNFTTNLGNSAKLLHLTQFLKQKLSTPDVSGLLSSSLLNISSTCTIKTTIRNAAITMKSSNSTAVLVLDDSGSLIGIFTTKDIVRRVISAKLDPSRTTMLRVMTPNPEFISAGSSLLFALEKMYAGKYLHLPVIGAGESVSLIDILDICVHIIRNVKKEIELDSFFSTTVSTVETQTQEQDLGEEDSFSILSLETTSSSKCTKGNRWSFKIRFENTVIFAHIPQLQLNLLNGAIKEKMQVGPNFVVLYKDVEGDFFTLSNDDDLATIVEMSLGEHPINQSELPICLYVSYPPSFSKKAVKKISLISKQYKYELFALAILTGIAFSYRYFKK